MSSAIKFLVVLIVLAGGAWLAYWGGWLTKPQTTATDTQQVATTTAPTPEPPQNMNGMSAANDAGDEALAQDMVAVDAQMQGLTNDSASLDITINDKPTPQAY